MKKRLFDCKSIASELMRKRNFCESSYYSFDVYVAAINQLLYLQNYGKLDASLCIEELYVFALIEGAFEDFDFRLRSICWDNVGRL